MKKLMMLTLAAVAMSFAACGVQTRNTAELDSLSFDSPSQEELAVDQANAIVALLQDQLQNADSAEVKAISDQIASQVAGFVAAGDEEAANRYTAIISQFIESNAVKLQQAGVPDAFAQAVASVKDIPAAIVKLATQTAEKTDSAAAAVQKGVDAVPQAVKEAVKEHASDIIDQVAAQAKKELGVE